jgi:hypothetical protein
MPRHNQLNAYKLSDAARAVVVPAAPATTMVAAIVVIGVMVRSVIGATATAAIIAAIVVIGVMVRPVVVTVAVAAIVVACIVPRPVIIAVVVAAIVIAAAAGAVAAFAAFTTILGKRHACRSGGESSQCKQAKRQPASKIFHDHVLR